MQQTQQSAQPPFGRQPRRPHLFILAILVLLIGIFTACGRSREPEGLPTEIPTLAVAQPPTATSAPTDTPEPVATSVPSTTNKITTTTTISASAETTTTAPLTDTEAVSETPTVTTPAVVTSTVPMTGTPVVTVTSLVTTTPAVTTTTEATPTAAVTSTSTVTTTTTVTSTSAMTGTGTMTHTGSMTGTASLTTTTGTTSTTVTPRIFFRQPTTGATIPVTSTVVMGVEGLKVEPAGDVHEGAGHFHILIDKDFIAAGDAIPKDATDLHFGQGQLTTTITLTPGIHVLHLQFGNGAHIALDGPQYRDTITVTVKADAPAQSVHFVTPENGATVTETFDVAMAAAGFIVEPAGAIHEGAGHFHILVDKDFVTTGDAIPKDAQDLHYGKGELKTKLTLKPGKHTLRLQFANGAHIALDGPQYRDEITVTVK